MSGACMVTCLVRESVVQSLSHQENFYTGLLYVPSAPQGVVAILLVLC